MYTKFLHVKPVHLYFWYMKRELWSSGDVTGRQIPGAEAYSDAV